MPIVLIGMMFGALAPQGFMPKVGADGFQIAICSGGGEAAIARGDPAYQQIAGLQAAMRSAGDDHRDRDDDSAKPHCAFAGAALAALLSDPVGVGAVAPSTPLPPALVEAIGRGRHHAATPPATGPPLLI